MLLSLFTYISTQCNHPHIKLLLLLLLFEFLKRCHSFNALWLELIHTNTHIMSIHLSASFLYWKIWKLNYSSNMNVSRVWMCRQNYIIRFFFFFFMSQQMSICSYWVTVPIVYFPSHMWRQIFNWSEKNMEKKMKKIEIGSARFATLSGWDYGKPFIFITIFSNAWFASIKCLISSPFWLVCSQKWINIIFLLV